jgi:hypothetical protein
MLGLVGCNFAKEFNLIVNHQLFDDVDRVTPDLRQILHIKTAEEAAP